VTQFRVRWDNGQRTELVETVAELDAVLDQIEHQRSSDGLPFMVDVTSTEARNQDFPVGLHMSLGHPERARVDWAGPPKPSTAFQNDILPWDGELIEFSYGGLPTEEEPETVRVSPEVAREAAREFVATGLRPTCVAWD
jgi:hypothetical protein